MKPTTLVIIDMQPSFTTSLKSETIRNIIRQINIAKRYNWGVIIVEYHMHGKTNAAIMSALGNHNRYVVVKKRHDNGSRVILNAAAKYGFAKQFR